MKTRVILAVLVLAALLSGCGGGGGTSRASYTVALLPDSDPGSSGALFVENTGAVTGFVKNDAAAGGQAFCLWATAAAIPQSVGGSIDTYGLHTPSRQHREPYYIDSNDVLVNVSTGVATSVPALPNNDLFYPLAVNSSGTCVGQYYLSGDTVFPRAAVWDGHSSFRMLDQPDWCSLGTEAQAINDSGQIAGVGHGVDAVKVIIWNADGSVLRELSPPASSDPIAALAVPAMNDGSTVVIGWLHDIGLQECSSAATIDATGHIHNLSFSGHSGIRICGINSAGQVVGDSGTRVILWSPSGQASTLPVPPSSLFNPAPMYLYCTANDINDNGVVVGTVRDDHMRTYAVQWTPSQ